MANDPQTVAIPSKEVLLSLAQDLPAVWNAPSTDMRLKQRIVHILIREIVVDIDEEKHEVVMLLHWAGGCHSELRIKKNAPGHRRNCTNLEAVEVVRRMVGQFGEPARATPGMKHACTRYGTTTSCLIMTRPIPRQSLLHSIRPLGAWE